MSDADKAYQIALERIERAKAAHPPARVLSLSPNRTDDGFQNRESTPELKALNRLPRGIFELKKLKELYLDGTNVEDISHLAAMTGIQRLSLNSTKVEDIAPLTAMTDIVTLDLGGTKVDRLSHLSSMTGMREFNLRGTQVADISHLATMTSMQALSLNGTRVADISPLAALTDIHTLDLRHTPVEDISPLAAMTSMQWLSLSSTKVKDISHLAAMSGMQVLHLTDTKVEDISGLAAMTGIKLLDLSGTKADLHQLVAEGSAWAEEDHALTDLAFLGPPASQQGGCLHDLYGDYHHEADRTKAALAALRAERDRRKVEAPAAITPSPTHGHIFLSYSREDADAARDLRQALEADGVTIWQDVDMAIGKRFRGEIDARIASAAAVLVLWSDASAASDYVQSEAERARQADKLTPALLTAITPPAPFDTFTTADLSGWRGDRGHPEYQRLLAALRADLTPDAPSGVIANDAGELEVEAEPVHAPFADLREDRKAEALRIQTRLAAHLADEALHANAHPRLEPRLRAYLEDLGDANPLWSTLDGVFAGIAPLLRDDGLDDGLKSIAANVVAGHDALRPFFTKEGAAEDPDWPDLPPSEGDEATKAMRDAAEAVEAGPFGVDLPEFLRDGASIIEAAQEEANEGPEAEERARKSGGRAVYIALGVLSSASTAILDAAGSASSVATYLATEAGQSLLSILGAAWQTLMRLVGLM